MFHIHALNNNTIYTIKQTMYIRELYLSHVIHHQHVSTAVTTKITVIYKITNSPNRLLKYTHCYKACLKLPTVINISLLTIKPNII